MDNPTVSIVTAHGRQELAAGDDELIVDLFSRHQVPWSAVSTYAVSSSDDPPRLISCLDSKVGDIDAKEILVYFNRNVNPFMFSLDGFKTVPSSGDAESTEYFYQDLNNSKSDSQHYLKKLSPSECKQVIAERVADVVREALPDGGDLVVGVSGGGDSNALLYGLSKIEGVNIHPLILKGIPDWDLGVPRAKELCDAYGLELTVVEETQVKEYLDIPKDSKSLIDRFEREFEGDDFEFLGTLLIRIALSQYAKSLGTEHICTGVNLEDIVCENMFRVSTGLKPASAPVRQIGDTKLLYPLWLCPKRILDGCFPKFSLENYDARYPCFSLGRNLYYSIVWSIQSQFPGYLEQLAQGMSKLSAADPVVYEIDEDLGFHVERFVPFPLRQKFKRMLGRA